MSFIILGIGSINDTGFNGAVLQIIISHGFIGAAFFFLARTSYDRLRLLYLDEMRNGYLNAKKFTIFTILSMTSLALSGMSGFVAELIVFFGIITSQKYFYMMKILS